MVEEYFENQSSETLQNQGFSAGLVNNFTMVEENFENQRAEALQNEEFSASSVNISDYD